MIDISPDLYLAPSTMFSPNFPQSPNRGLFAKKDIKKGSCISSGLMNDPLVNFYSILTASNDQEFYSAIKQIIEKYGDESKDMINVERNEEGWHASKNIKAGSELYYEYGRKYWLHVAALYTNGKTYRGYLQYIKEIAENRHRWLVMSDKDRESLEGDLYKTFSVVQDSTPFHQAWEQCCKHPPNRIFGYFLI